MNIHHRPIFETQRVCEHYSEKENVAIKYVCTSAIGSEERAMDIFYRETPHPDFGNHYFGLFYSTDYVMITNADAVELIDFEMVEVFGQLHYSQHRHDFYTIADVSIDGGRAYFRVVGNANYPQKTLKVVNGEFYEN